MKQLLSILALTIMVILLTSCSTTPSFNAKGPIAHWTFDNCRASDVTGNGQDGKINGSPQCVDGKVSKAFKFDGVDDFLQISNLTEINKLSTAFTITGWFKAQSFKYSDGTAWLNILTKGNTSDTKTAFAVTYASQGSNLVPHIRFTGKTGDLYFQNLTGNAGVENKWVFFAWTWERGILNVYRDGKFVVTTNTEFTELKQDNLPLEIGRDAPVATEFLNGIVDDIRIYNYALTSQEIASLFNLANQ